MTRKKTNDEFINELKTIWENEFYSLDEYKGHDKKIRVRHENCQRILQNPQKFGSLEIGL